MLHRATLGSFERFIGILIENFEGKLPTWLSPMHAVVINITDRQAEYVQKVTAELQDKGFRAEYDLRNEKIGFKIRDWTLKRVPYILVAGDREMDAGEITVRSRDGKDLGSFTVEELALGIGRELDSYGQETLQASA